MKIYLTFDAGYENGNTEKILDTLKANEVKATFFIVGNYLEICPEIVKRMVEEGHIVANHSYYHKTINTQTNEELASDLKKLEDSFKKVTGKEMVKVFRPPKGEFDRESLLNLKHLGLLYQN